MIKINDGTQTKRISGKAGDRTPQTGLKRDRAVYVATGGETSIDLSVLSPAISYMPGMSQLTVKRSSIGNLISGYNLYERTVSSIGFSTPLASGEWVEIIKEVEITGIQAASLRPDIYSTTSTNGQTIIAADFSWPYNLNPTKGLGGCEVFLHGILQTRGIDYTEVNLGTANTNQIQFTDALAGGENVIIKPTYQVLDQSAAATTFYGQQISSVQGALSAGTQGFVGVSKTLSAPYTTVVNRAKIPDITTDLKVSFGLERIITQGIFNIQGETGTNSEPVFGALNDDRGLIRFVGAGWSNFLAAAGAAAFTTGLNDYVEITFYGTGLNLITATDVSARDYRASVDGGAEGSNLQISSGSGIITNRNYSSNSPVSVTSGLALGVHTVKIRTNNTSGLIVYGFEVINAASATNLMVNPGYAYLNGLKYSAPSSQTLAWAGAVTGTRGGRSVIYLKTDGSLGQSFTAANPSAAYLASADHTNEEPVRTYFPREFGAGRADDFSKTAPIAYASLGSILSFTLDDGTTSLIVSSGDFVSGLSKEALACRVNGGTQYINFVFVGTGLDVELLTDSTARQFDSITVDGTLVSTPITKAASSAADIRKIVSGLAYGTHTVKFNISGVQSSPAIGRFIVYQPKKPTVPENCIELSDYNVMANYVPNTTAGLDTIGTGVLRKDKTREISYSGTWTSSMSLSNTIGGIAIDSTAVGNTASYTFFGTGFDMRYLSNTDAGNVTVSIDGLTATSANFPTANFSAYGSTTSFSTSTGILNQNAVLTPGCGFSVSGLNLGVHTVKITHSTGTTMRINTFDIITPVHSYKPNIYADFQNTLNIGSNSLTDLRKTSMFKEVLPATKSWSQAIGITSGPTTTTTSFIPCPDLSCSIRTTGGPVELAYSLTAMIASTGSFAAAIYVDGVSIGTAKYSGSAGNINQTLADSIIVTLAAGFHKVDVYWYTSGPTATAYLVNRNLTVREL